MQAALDGKDIEFVGNLTAEWTTASAPIWEWDTYDYRIKPEPMELLVDIYNGNRYEIASDRNRSMLGKLGEFKTIKMREVLE